MINWQVATLLESKDIAKDVKSLRFSVTPWNRPKAGQHYNIRLTAEDGYQAERDYSLASAPEDEGIVELGVQLLKNGEVSPYLFQMSTGEKIEIRGPIGGHFIWETSMEGPLVLVGGGSGMVPLMSMLRHAFNNPDDRKIVFLISAKSEESVLYKEELKKMQEKNPNLKVVFTYTENPPPNWQGFMKRLDEEILEKALSDLKNENPKIYICGRTGFVENAANSLVAIGFNPKSIKTERFG